MQNVNACVGYYSSDNKTETDYSPRLREGTGWSENHCLQNKRKRKSDPVTHPTQKSLWHVSSILYIETFYSITFPVIIIRWRITNELTQFHLISISSGSQLYQIQPQTQHALHDLEHSRRGTSGFHHWLCSITEPPAVFIGGPSDLPASWGHRPRRDIHGGPFKGRRVPGARAWLREGVEVHAAYRSVWLLPGPSQQPPGGAGYQRAGQEWPRSPLHRRSCYHCHPREHRARGSHIYIPGSGSGVKQNIIYYLLNRVNNCWYVLLNRYSVINLSSIRQLICLKLNKIFSLFINSLFIRLIFSFSSNQFLHDSKRNCKQIKNRKKSKTQSKINIDANRNVSCGSTQDDVFWLIVLFGLHK